MTWWLVMAEEWFLTAEQSRVDVDMYLMWKPCESPCKTKDATPGLDGLLGSTLADEFE